MGKARPASKPPGKPEGPPVHAVLKGDAKDIQLLVSPDRLAAYVNVVFHTRERSVTVDELLAFLQEQKVKVVEEGMANIEKAVGEAVQAVGTLGPVLVARGSAAKKGRDGRIEWLVPPPEALREKKIAVGRVNYREYHQIVNVRQGQKILSIVPHTPGEPGEDIFGVAINCEGGQPVSMRKGKNVEVAPDGKEFIAQVTGMLQVSADVVLIEPIIVVPNDVDMSVGNINFVGPVKVTRDVRDGFHVKAGKEIEVGGMAEGAVLESESFIRIQGGVAGKGRGRILCKGNLEAKYLSEVSVEAGGDVIVANSITNSTVKSLGRVVVNSGGIRGANVIAQKGLHAPELGSESGVRTIVIVGFDYHLKDRFANLEGELSAIREAVEKIETALGPLLTDADLISILPPEKSEIARRLMTQLDVLVKRGNELAARRDAMVAKMQAGSDMFIEVTKKIFAGVVMQIGTCKRTFELEVTGPVKIYPDMENASVRVSR